jgi:hypothetical protein
MRQICSVCSDDFRLAVEFGRRIGSPGAVRRHLELAAKTVELSHLLNNTNVYAVPGGTSLDGMSPDCTLSAGST